MHAEAIKPAPERENRMRHTDKRRRIRHGIPRDRKNDGQHQQMIALLYFAAIPHMSVMIANLVTMRHINVCNSRIDFRNWLLL